MYAYKFVAKESNQDEFFSGKVAGHSDFDNYFDDRIGDIVNGIDPVDWVYWGIFMKGNAVVTFILKDHKALPMENTSFKLGVDDKTRDGNLTIQDSNIIVKGTQVLLNVPIDWEGKETVTVTPPSYYPVPFAGQSVTLVPGSNLVEVA